MKGLLKLKWKFSILQYILLFFQVSFKITYVLQLNNWKINLFLYCGWHCHNDIIIAMTIRMTMLVTLFLVLINIHNTIQTNSPKVSYRSSINNTVITEEGQLKKNLEGVSSHELSFKNRYNPGTVSRETCGLLSWGVVKGQMDRKWFFFILLVKKLRFLKMSSLLL